MSNPFVYIIVLNWNGWQDTIACLESVYSLSARNYRVIVVDNNSSDDSVKNISKFLSSGSRCWSFVDYSCDEKKFLSPSFLGGEEIFFVRSNKNIGYGAGNNIGLKLIKELEKEKFIDCLFWILNNDTCVQADALSNLLRRYLVDANSGLKIGLYGTTIKNYCKHDEVIAYCGRFNKITGAVSHVTEREVNWSEFRFEDGRGFEIYYPVGASIFFGGPFLSEVGGLCENHFLYYEEIEWILRGYKYDWDMRVVEDAVVFHKEGASTGGGDLSNRSFTSDFYFLRSRIIIARKIGGIYGASIVIFSLIAALRRLFSRRKGMFKNALAAVCSGLVVKISGSWKI